MPSLTDVRFAELVQDIACDVHSKTQDDDNILKVQEISRAFVSDTLTGILSRYGALIHADGKIS
ncbi:hypothetical protein F4604DRAFT_1712176 [Suillus subluteus]|nr:hypothetical protein F4604DRAFT_1712176 [Suillus subluteus]